MSEISITGFGLTKMCRLCLSSDVTILDLFSFSIRFENLVANAIMKCAPVQIRNGDGMPNFICEECYTRLEKTHQFQMQIIQSDKTLQRYLEQLAFDKNSKLESIQRPSENPLIDNTNADNASRKSSELNDEFDINVNWREKEYENYKSASEINIEVSLKSETKEEQDNSIISPDNADDIFEPLSKDGEKSLINLGDNKLVQDMIIMNVNWKLEEPANFDSICKNIKEMSLKSEIKDEPMDDSLILTESIDDSLNDCFKGVSETSCEDAKVGFGIKSEEIKDTSIDCEKHTQVDKVKSRHFKINDTCKKRYAESSFMKTHKRARTSEKPYQCDICKKCFTQSRTLKTHKLTHTDKTPYQCDICKKYFIQSSHLNAHKLTHTGEKPYHCDICKKCFTCSGTLKNHKLTHTGEKPYQCDICKKCFTQPSTLNSHKLTHTDEKSYHCDICKKCFTHSGTLKTHKLTHTGEKPHQCDICKKCFTHSGTLKKHKLTHTGEKPYQCDICKKCFTQSSTLNSHKLTHTGEKRHHCDICKKCFTYLSNLNAHKLTHTGEKPYQCDICKKCFGQSGNLNSHKLTHTGVKPYQCDICKKCFAHSKTLNNHKLSHT